MQVIAYYNYDASNTQAPLELQRLFKNSIGGRKKLLKYVLEDKNIRWDEKDREQIEWRILHAFPSAANELISGGCIRVEEAYG